MTGLVLLRVGLIVYEIALIVVLLHALEAALNKVAQLSVNLVVFLIVQMLVLAPAATIVALTASRMHVKQAVHLTVVSIAKDRVLVQKALFVENIVQLYVELTAKLNVKQYVIP